MDDAATLALVVGDPAGFVQNLSSPVVLDEVQEAPDLCPAINLADVSRDASLAHTTLTRYLALLETVFLVHRLPAWSPNLGKRLVKAPKLHLADTGLACHLLGADVKRLGEDRPLLGRVLETFVLGELRKQLSWTDPRAVLCHFRAAAGAEVDVVRWTAEVKGS